MSRRAARDAFDPQWLSGRLQRLLPGFPEVRVCVAFSGGVDSVALLAALAQLRVPALRIRAVHVDHGLHPSSHRWSAHCRAFAASLGVPLKVLRTRVSRVRGQSLEALARAARYELLAGDLSPGEVLLTAHHEDDQLETVLLQLFRGCGLAGLAAMPEVAGFAGGILARPLLSASRSQLQAWVRASGLEWVEDDTNADERLDRNYLRRRIVPLLRERWPGVAKSVARSARHAAQAQQLLEASGRRDAGRAADGRALLLGPLRALPPGRRRNAVRFWIAASGFPLPDTRRLEEICFPLLAARADANPHVAWNGVLVRRDSQHLTLSAAGPAHPLRMGQDDGPGPGEGAEVSWNWRRSRTCALGGERGKLELRPDPLGPIDLDSLPEQVFVRARAGGERIRVRRGGPRRALKSLLQEARVPLAERSSLPLIWSDEQLLAVADLWWDACVQASAGAARRARLIWTRGPAGPAS